MERRRRISVQGDRIEGIVRAVAATQGIEVVPRGQGELEVVQLEHADGAGRALPIVVIATERLRASDVEALERSGVDRVLDGHSNVLDLAFAFSELLFDTLAEQRRYSRTFESSRVRFWRLEAPVEGDTEGQLLSMGKSGAFLATDRVVPEGDPIAIELELLGRRTVLRARVACQSWSLHDRGLSVEFALDDEAVAPRLQAYFNAVHAEPSLPTRGIEVRGSSLIA